MIGRALVQSGDADPGAVESAYFQALELAKGQGSKTIELRVTTSLAELWQSQGKRQQAYDILVPVYEWFTEGLDMPDLKQAKVLLDELH